jgi:hypothetical protein
MKCQCLTSKGKPCTNTASTKSGDNPQFCWQHQGCTKPILVAVPIVKKNSPKPQKLTLQKKVSVAKLPVAKLRGPFHLFNMYYKHQEFNIETYNDENELRELILHTFEDYPSTVNQLKTFSLNDLMAYYQKHRGVNMIENDDGWGCVGIVEGGMIIEPEEPSIDVPLKHVDEEDEVEEQKPDPGSLTEEEIEEIQDLLNEIMSAVGGKEKANYRSYRKRLQEALQLPASAYLKEQIKGVLVAIEDL